MKTLRIGKKSEKRDNVMIIGCSRLGVKLAGTLSTMGYNLTIIDKDESSFFKLPDTYSGYEVCADGTDANILKENGIDNVKMLIAVTENENANILIARIAREIFDVPEVYIRLTDIEKETLVEDKNIKAIYPFKLCMEEFERISSVEIDEQ